ncbi:EpsG family protein [Aliivibrio fischeri]|uniref:EpsG family protein n=1 Tax=Aliivibrio fischeri TaxID=668 RepID=UPI00080E1651|nr:EpsG family protein [Aliivibrio fischeri]OCH04142.1 hypothetical protein A6E10_02395 [Aliivibrio fischeri]
MIAYYIVNLLLFLVGLSYSKFDNQLRFFILLILATFCSFYFGSRYQVGVDWKNYIVAFEYYNYYPKDFSLEIGYKLINIIAYNLEFDIQFVIYTTTFIVFFVSLFSLYFMKLNPCYYIGIVFPYYIVMGVMNYTRQGVALSFFLLALCLLFNNKRKLFLVAIVVGSTFHVSLIMFSIFFFYDMKKRYLFFMLSIISIPLVILLKYQYSMYIKADFDSKGLLLRSVFVLFSSLALVVNKHIFENYKYKNIFYFSMVSPIFIFLVAIVSTTMADRISYYFILLSALCCYFLCLMNGVRFKRFILPLLFLCSLSVFIVWSIYSSYIPYYEFKSQIFSGLF